MGRSAWLLKIGCFLLYFGGGLMTYVDAHLSQGWIARMTNADKVMPHLSLGMAFAIAVLASGFGAIFTAPYSWQIIFMECERIANIRNENRRLLAMAGASFLGIVLLIGTITIYSVDILSTNAQVKNLSLAILIVFSADLCFLLANILGYMEKVAKANASEFEMAMFGHSSPRTVDVNGRRG